MKIALVLIHFSRASCSLGPEALAVFFFLQEEKGIGLYL
jgi:hypothetical protein